MVIDTKAAGAFRNSSAPTHKDEAMQHYTQAMVVISLSTRSTCNSAKYFQAAMAREVCKLGSVPVQDFLVRNDSPCGSTIGPMLSANLGIRSIDIGATQWAMHSCRETCGIEDVLNIQQACLAFYKHWRQVDNAHKEA